MRHTRCALGTGVQTWALPILEDDPYHALAKRYLGGKGGGVCTLGLKGGYDAGVKLVSSVKMFSHLANLGDTRSLIIHPASTTHSQLSEAELVETGAGPDVVRVSVGIEHIDRSEEHTSELQSLMRISYAVLCLKKTKTTTTHRKTMTH